MKKKLLYWLQACVFLSSVLSISVSAMQPIQITFEDLQSQIAPYNDPFEHLSDEQLYNISAYARVKEMKATFPELITYIMQQEADKAKAALLKDEIDPDALFAKGQAIIEKYEAASTVPNDLLTDKEISIPGYMLALEYQDKKVTEFLLVPYIGACSHKPVPAANQILYVKMKEPVAAGLPYLPIQVTGTLRVVRQEKNLYLVDGQVDIKMIYTLEDATVKAYSRPKDQSFIVE